MSPAESGRQRQSAVSFSTHRCRRSSLGRYLPLFNSHAIAQWIDRIPGLAERFIYANDDTMFGAPVTPDQFCTPDGRALVRFDGPARRGDGMHNEAVDNAAGLLDRVFGPRASGRHRLFDPDS